MPRTSPRTRSTAQLAHPTRSSHTPHAFARVDLEREMRCGAAEVIYGPGKTPGQIVRIAKTLRAAGQPVLISRIEPGVAAVLRKGLKGLGANYDPVSRLISIGGYAFRRDFPVGVCAAGTSDLPVAEEAAQACTFFGLPVTRFTDIGVAGLHRLLAVQDDLRRMKVIIVVAGMEGALPSVVGGLVACPVIAVPTSVGYGANFQGLSALLGMLNSCASGLTVVNIDNGFGAAYAALRIAGNPANR
ncbi:MAG: nickel pincer cofactor biosynthesis protein LarB [Candidatus Methylacidiphilales bacterium]|nr:nickel pincer cofactor biosynthesis protein LarB [Candidatus Methylacidiphilales bacterium]